VVNKKTHGLHKDDVYIGRGSKWGNPFKIGVDGTRDEVCEKYIVYMTERMKEFKSLYDIRELQGKRLMCFCKPLRCHGDWLAALANGEIELQ
jgi:hypothetical protein